MAEKEPSEPNGEKPDPSREELAEQLDRQRRANTDLARQLEKASSDNRDLRVHIARQSAAILTLVEQIQRLQSATRV